MNYASNKIKVVVIGLLVIGTLAAGARTISILHNNQLVLSKVGYLKGTTPVVAPTNPTPTKTTTKKPAPTPATTPAKNNDDSNDNSDDSQITPVASGTTFTLTITPSTSGIVISSPSGIACGSSCSTTFSPGTLVTLSAAATSGYTFSGWSSTSCPGTGTCAVTMNSNQTILASFTLGQNPSSPASGGSGYTASQVSAHNSQGDCWLIISGKVYNVTSFISQHPGGVNAIVSRCGTDATTAYTTNGNGGHAHSAYAQSLLPTYYVGDLTTGSSNNNPPPVTIYTLSVTKSGTGSGSVSGGSISCGTTCSTTVNAGTSVSLTAAATSGSTFVSWGGACSGTGTCSLTLNSNQSVTATFNTTTTTPPPPGTFTLSVTSINGTVTSNPSAISCGSTCSATLGSGTSVILTVIPSSGHTFTGWSGACSGTSTSCTVQMNTDKTVTANYN
ncbi:cytochrome b5 domain-containing protein [Candidatus Nomurabacteria bacterium]|nr:cytochrome b5 domain-containing protein [Candidatus Nomurabacteria bacterium]